MKKITKKNLWYKPESERTKKEKLVRDIVFFGVVVYAAIMTFLVIDAEYQLAESECVMLSAEHSVSVPLA